MVCTDDDTAGIGHFLKSLTANARLLIEPSHGGVALMMTWQDWALQIKNPLMLGLLALPIESLHA